MRDVKPATMEELNRVLATIPDPVLAERCAAWIDKLCKTGGGAWSLRVPVQPGDPDVLITELINRFKRGDRMIRLMTFALKNAPSEDTLSRMKQDVEYGAHVTNKMLEAFEAEEKLIDFSGRKLLNPKTDDTEKH